MLPPDLLDNAVAIANTVWGSCIIHEQPLPETADNWVTVAINRTSGYLLDFYFGVLRSLGQDRAQEQTQIQSILQALEIMVDGDSSASEVVRILVSANAHLLAGIAPDWYSEHVLSLLATPATLRTSEQCWDGYLVWATGRKRCFQD
jgi:hypothetical protein